MKKSLTMMVLAIVLTTAPFSTRAFAAGTLATDSAATVATERMEQIKSRLEEIKAMDKSALTREERKELRGEVKAMRGEVTEIKGHSRTYIAIGAVLFVILILIIVL